MENKIILDLCGGTGAWSKPYRNAGYDVRVITLPDYDVTRVVFSGDYLTFNKRTYDVYDMEVRYKDVYGILAAPPCTEFSLAKGNQPRDFRSGLETMNACLRIIQECRLHTKLAFWAMENPVGFMRQFMGHPHYTFEQWQFGDAGIKPTDVWGWFKEPRQTVKTKPDGLIKRYSNGRINAKQWCNANCPDDYKGMGINRAEIRAITPPGFAQAFYGANK